MRVGVDGLSAYKEPAVLERAWYKWEVTDTKVIEKQQGNDSLLLQLTCVEGPDQIEDGNASPVGREASVFLVLGTAAMSKKGADFVKSRLLGACKGFGVELASDDTFDPDEFRGKLAMGLNVPRKNRDSGKLEENITEFKTAE